MNFNSHVNVALNPDVKLRARTKAVEFAIRSAGALKIEAGRIHAEIGVVPVSIALPFMAGRRVVLARVGPFRFVVKPVACTVECAELGVQGKLGGEEGIEATAELVGKCRAEIEATGETDVKVLKAAFEGVFHE